MVSLSYREAQITKRLSELSIKCLSCFFLCTGDENVTVEIPMPPSDQEDEQSTHIYVVIGMCLNKPVALYISNPGLVKFQTL